MRCNIRRRHLKLIVSSLAVGLLFFIISMQLKLDVKSVKDVMQAPVPTRSMITDQPLIERFSDEKVDRLVELISNYSLFEIAPLAEADFTVLAKSLGQRRRNQADYTKARPKYTFNRTQKTNFQLFHYGIQTYSMYNPDDPAIEGLIHDMANLTITAADILRSGSELKLDTKFIDGGRAVMKPMRNKREYETSPDQFQFEDFERHNAEIAGFHLSRVLGFYFVPPVTGRMVDLGREIRPLAEVDLNKTFFYSPAGNLCFWGKCSEFCDPKHSFCGKGEQIEVSLMAFLPNAQVLSHKHPNNPYRSTYSRWNPANYAKTDDFCERNVYGKDPIKNIGALLNLIDLHIFDFLQGNRDRHTLNFYEEVGTDGFFNVIDNGRGSIAEKESLDALEKMDGLMGDLGVCPLPDAWPSVRFGKTKIDEYGILAPLWQCCKIRTSTLKKFVSLYLGPRPLSYYLDQSLKSDPLYPILVDGHLTAVNRRATRVLTAVMECVESGHSLQDIVIDTPI